MVFRLTKILSSAYLAQPGPSMATRRSSRSSSANSSKPLFPNSCFICRKTCNQQNQKDIVAKNILTLLAEATIKAAAKDKTFKTQTLILSLMSFFVPTLAINYLFSAASAVVFEKPLEWPTLRKLWTILFLFP